MKSLTRFINKMNSRIEKIREEKENSADCDWESDIDAFYGRKKQVTVTTFDYDFLRDEYKTYTIWV
jgi:hypothetical protein